jgi:hypothetical protein
MDELAALRDTISESNPDMDNCQNCGDMLTVEATYKAILAKLGKEKEEDKEADKAKAAKKCVDFAKKCMKKNKVKGKAEAVDGACEVTCEGKKEELGECEKSIKEFCKEQKVTCKCKKTVEKEEKKAFVIRDRSVIEAMNEIDSWLKEG